jgi:hypothetical protein
MRRRNPLPRLAYAASPQRSEWLQTSKFNVLDGGNFEMYCTNKDGYEHCEL